MAFSASKMGLVLEGAGAVGVAALRAGVVAARCRTNGDRRAPDRPQRGAEAALGGAPFLRSAPTAPRSTTRSRARASRSCSLPDAASRPWPGTSRSVPALVAAGYQVVTFDNRGVEPSSSPPAPYSVEGMAADTACPARPPRLDEPVRLAGHSMGGWIAETLVLDHPGSGAVGRVDGQCQRADGLGGGHHHRRARPGPPRLRPAAALLRHRDPALPAHRRHSGLRSSARGCR